MLPEEVTREGKRLKRVDTPYGSVYKDPETGRVYLPEELGLAEEPREEPVIEIGEPEEEKPPKEPPERKPEEPMKKPEEARVEERKPEEKPAEKKAEEKKPEEEKPEQKAPRKRGERKAAGRRGRQTVGGRARRAARQVAREVRDAFFAQGVYFPLALQKLAFATAYTVLIVLIAYADRILYNWLQPYGVLTDVASVLAAPLHFIALTSLTLLASTLLLTIVRVWRGRGLKKGVWTVNLVEAVAFTVMATLLAWLCRNVYIVVLVGVAAGIVGEVAVHSTLFLLPYTILGALLSLKLSWLVILVVLLLSILLPFVAYFLVVPLLLVIQLLLLGRQTRELQKTLDLGLVLMLGLFALLRALAPSLAAAAAVAGVLIAGILAVSTGDIGWLRLIAAVIAVWWSPLDWRLDEFLEPVYTAYVEIVGTPGAYYGYRLLKLLLQVEDYIAPPRPT